MTDTKGWGEFCVRDFFKVLKGRNKLSITDINDGNVPVYSSSSKGGIFGYTTKQPDYLITKDTPLYITFGDHTKAINIAEQNFCVMDNVKVLTTELRNRNILRFIITSWLKNIPNLGYARHWSKAEMAKIYLPVILDGQLDWAYMESYMKKIMEESEKSLENLKKSNCDNRLIDTRSWKNYMLGNLFELVNSKAYHNKYVVEVKDENGLLYVTRSKFNNGIKCKVEKKSEYIINPAGTISFGAENADFFYQKKEYITGNKMYYINTCNISELAALFLKSVLEATFTKKFSFSNGMVPNRIRNEIISLPAMPDGQPDWEYMENYMKKVMKKSEQAISTLRTVV